MNERIKELAEQARNALAVDAMSGGEFNMKAYEQKLAELIIKECAEQICQGPFYAGAAAKYIKEHFGVE